MIIDIMMPQLGIDKIKRLDLKDKVEIIILEKCEKEFLK
jgi:hypothetical protein